MDDLAAGELSPEGQTPAPGRPDAAGEAGSDAIPGANPDGRSARVPRLLHRPGWLNSRRPGDSRRVRLGATALGLSLVLILGFKGAASQPNGPAGGSSSSQRPSAGQSGAAMASRAPAGTGLESGSPLADASPSAEPSEVPIPTQTSPTATITFNDLMLDSVLDATAAARTFSFISDGPGAVSAQIVATSPLDSTKLCVTADDKPAGCVSGATPSLRLAATAAHSHWVVTLSSVNESSPTVDLAIGWPTNHPSITLTHGRLAGYPNPDSLRSMTATFVTRAAGQLGIEASWPPAVLDATLTVADVSAAQPAVLASIAYSGRSGISPAYSLALQPAKAYRVVLFNESPDGVRPNLAATISFP